MLEAAVTGWHLLFGKERGGSDVEYIVTDRATLSGRQRTARRFAVGRRGRLGASIALSGLPGAAGGALLPSRPLRPITTTSSIEYGP
jgi:hypothetical protein